MESILGRLVRKRHNEFLETLVKRIENDPSLADSEGKINIDRLNEILEELLQTNTKKSESIVKGWDFSKEKSEPVFAENRVIRLCPFTEVDRGFYAGIREQYTRIAINTSPEAKEQAFWEDTLPDIAFFCTIVLCEEDIRIGYIGFKNTASNLWEIAIEIDKEYCGKGYGGMAIQLFLNRTKEITGKQQYQALVEVDNRFCQKCMEKLNAELIDLFNLMFADETEAEAFERENMELITLEMIQLAEKLGVEPRKLLSNVLDYRIYV